jgi:hypothetical protein
MPVYAKTWDQVMAREYSSRGTPEQQWADALGVASAVYNRAIATGTDYNTVVADKSQFNAYNLPMQPGDLKRTELAKAAMAQVEQFGPVHNGTYYATPAAVGNLPKGLEDTGYEVPTGHVYKNDPLSRAIVVKGGAVPANQDNIEAAIALGGANAPVPTSRPETQIASAAPVVTASAYAEPMPAATGAVAAINSIMTPASQMNTVDLSKAARDPNAQTLSDTSRLANGINEGTVTARGGAQAGYEAPLAAKVEPALDPGRLGNFATDNQMPGYFDIAGALAPQTMVDTSPTAGQTEASAGVPTLPDSMAVSALSSALTGASTPASATVSGMPDPGGYDMAGRAITANSPSNVAQGIRDISAPPAPTEDREDRAPVETAQTAIEKTATPAAAPTRQMTVTDPAPAPAPATTVAPAPTVAPASTVTEASPADLAVSPEDPRYDLNGVPMSAPAATDLPASAMPSNVDPNGPTFDPNAQVSVSAPTTKTAIETRSEVEPGSTYEGPVEGSTKAKQGLAEGLLGTKGAAALKGAAKGALAGGVTGIGAIPGAIGGGIMGALDIHPLQSLINALTGGANSSYAQQMSSITNIGGGLANVASVYGGGPGAVGTQANTNNGGTVTGLPGGGVAYTNPGGVTTVTTPNGGQAADWSGRDYSPTD